MNFNAAQFIYRPAGKVYIAEASDLRISVPDQRSIDIDGATFLFTHADKDISGEDVMGWNYSASWAAVRVNPALAGHRVLIIND